MHITANSKPDYDSKWFDHQKSNGNKHSLILGWFEIKEVKAIFKLRNLKAIDQTT